MALAIEKMTRVFKYMGKTMPDPNPKMSPEQLKPVFALQYPEIASAGIDMAIEKGRQVITYQQVIGKKG